MTARLAPRRAAMHRYDLLLDLTQFRFREAQMLEELAEQKSMMLGYTTFQRQFQFRDLVPQQPFGHLGQSGSVLLPNKVASKLALPEAPKASVATDANLMLASSQHLLNSIRNPVDLLYQTH